MTVRPHFTTIIPAYVYSHKVETLKESRQSGNTMRAYPTANQSLLAANLLTVVTSFIKLPGGLLPMHGRCPNISNGLPPAVLLFDDSHGHRRPDHPRKRRIPLDLEAKRGRQCSSGRPSLDDVERLSMGQAAKKRGTGSRRVCHRLNESERKVCRPGVWPP